MKLYEIATLRFAVESKNGCTASFLRTIRPLHNGREHRVGVFQLREKPILAYAWFEPDGDGSGIEGPRIEVTSFPLDGDGSGADRAMQELFRSH